MFGNAPTPGMMRVEFQARSNPGIGPVVGTAHPQSVGPLALACRLNYQRLNCSLWACIETTAPHNVCPRHDMSCNLNSLGGGGGSIADYTGEHYRAY